MHTATSTSEGQKQNELRVHNFGAGPATLPLDVLKQVQAELINFRDTGMSVMEMSHRSKEFEAIMDSATADMRTFMQIPDEFEVLFMQGGGTLQFSVVPLFFKHAQKKTNATYIVTGVWSKKAKEEAENLGLDVNCANIADFEPKLSQSATADYIYLCENETVDGVEVPLDFYDKLRDVHCPIVVDASSSFLSRQINFESVDLVFAGAQKNAGPAGLTIVLIRKQLLERSREGCHPLPLYLDYSVHAKHKSLYNTPPTFSVYVTGLVLKWLLKEFSSVHQCEQWHSAASKSIYDIIDEFPAVFHCKVPRNLRSRVNITFDVDDLSAFISGAEKLNMVGLKGHRSVGGVRISKYNALKSTDALDCLTTFMRLYAQGKASNEKHKEQWQ